MDFKMIDIIKRRRSTRTFLPGQISDEALHAIVEAGQYAPNGGGEAWHFSVVQNAGILEQVNLLAKQFAVSCGLVWLEELGRDSNFHSTYHAPTVVFVSGDMSNICAQSDTAAATQNLLLAAESLNIGSCWGYFATQAFQTEEGQAMRAKLGIPDGYTVYTSVMLGYRAAEPPAPQKRKSGAVTYLK